MAGGGCGAVCWQAAIRPLLFICDFYNVKKNQLKYLLELLFKGKFIFHVGTDSKKVK